MHEASIMQCVFDIAFAKLAEEGATRIHRLRLRVGALAGVVPEALTFAFDALKTDTPAADAALDVEYVPVRLCCPRCVRDFAGDNACALCPTCGAATAEVSRGHELDLVSLEVSREEQS